MVRKGRMVAGAGVGERKMPVSKKNTLQPVVPFESIKIEINLHIYTHIQHTHDTHYYAYDTACSGD